MFNGIIESTGRVSQVRQKGGKFSLVIVSAGLFKRLKAGNSVSVSGVCLTATKRNGKKAVFDVVPETLNRTVLGQLRKGDTVNLELPLKWEARVSGHFVLGHVDGVGRIKKTFSKGPQNSFLIEFTRQLRPLITEKGSIAVDGVSLTIGKVVKNSFWVHVIPHTFENTNFKRLEVGSAVNLEGDYLAKLKLTSHRGHYKLLR